MIWSARARQRQTSRRTTKSTRNGGILWNGKKDTHNRRAEILYWKGNERASFELSVFFFIIASCQHRTNISWEIENIQKTLVEASDRAWIFLSFSPTLSDCVARWFFFLLIQLVIFSPVVVVLGASNFQCEQASRKARRGNKRSELNVFKIAVGTHDRGAVVPERNLMEQKVHWNLLQLQFSIFMRKNNFTCCRWCADSSGANISRHCQFEWIFNCSLGWKMSELWLIIL